MIRGLTPIRDAVQHHVLSPDFTMLLLFCLQNISFTMSTARRNVCLCHTRDKTEEKLSKFTKRSWETYTRSAKHWTEIAGDRLSEHFVDIAVKSKASWDTEDPDLENIILSQRLLSRFYEQINDPKAIKRSRQGESTLFLNQSYTGTITVLVYSHISSHDWANYRCA